MVLRKRKTTKTGGFTQRTTTIGSKGRTDSFSSKPPGGQTRRTVSFSNGKMRTTYSTKTGGGWTKVSSKTTTLSSRPKKRSSGGVKGRKTGGDFSWTFWKWAIIIWVLLWLFT